MKATDQSGVMKLVTALAIAGPIVVLSLLLFNPLSKGAVPDSLQVSYIDVGQGDSIWLHTSDNTDVLIDGGPPGAGPTVVAYLQGRGIDDIEVLLLTHADADHSGGLIDVLRSAIPVSAVLYNGLSASTTTYQTLIAEIQNRGLTPTPAVKGQVYNWGPLGALVLNPQSASTGNQNEDSVMLLVSYADKRLLFTGDIGASTEQTILDLGVPLAANVLKVAHHGSRNSSTANFLAASVAPLAVISVGADNPYGHPHQETLNRLAASGYTVRRTDQEGTIVLTFTGGATLATPTPVALIFVPIVLRNWPPTATPTATSTPTWTSVPSATATQTTTAQATATSTPTPTATELSVQADLHITALSYSASDEYVQITNQGSGAQNMTGWRIHSVTGDQWYTFPAGYILNAGATVRIHSGAGALNNPPTDLLWGYAYIWNNTGDKAVLYNSASQPADSSCYLSGCP